MVGIQKKENLDEILRKHGCEYSAGDVLIDSYGAIYDLDEIYINEDRGTRIEHQVIFKMVDRETEHVHRRSLSSVIGSSYVIMNDSEETLRAIALRALADPSTLDELDPLGSGKGEGSQLSVSDASALPGVRALSKIASRRIEIINRMILKMLEPLKSRAWALADRTTYTPCQRYAAFLKNWRARGTLSGE